MSTKIASKVWSLRGIPSTTKLIMIKLADNANDAGVCWPSIQMVADECEVSDRTVQAAIIWAENHGLIEREMRSGKRSIYTITPEGYSEVTPEAASPRKIFTPENDDIIPPKSTTQTPEIHDVAYIEEPSIEEPSIEPSITDDAFAQLAFESWNDFADEFTLPKAQLLSTTRKAAMKRRLAECGGIEGWDVCLSKIRGSPFLLGKTTNFRSTLDWVLKPSNFTKIMEGNYDDRAISNTANHAKPQNGFAAILHELAEGCA